MWSTLRIHWAAGIFILANIVFLRGVELTAHAEKEGAVTVSFREPIESAAEGLRLDFNRDSSHLCFSYSVPKADGDNTHSLHYWLISTNGTIIGSSEGKPNLGLVRQFPRLATYVFHAGIIEHALSWDTKCDDPSCVVVALASESAVVVKMWSLNGDAILRWSWQSSQEVNGLARVCYVCGSGTECVIVNLGGEIVFLSARDGTRISSIPLQEVAMSACAISDKGLVAFGGFGSKQIRVVQMAPPHKTLQVLGKVASNRLGNWSTVRVEYASGAGLLLKESIFSSRLLRYTKETEVFDTRTWKPIWQHEMHEKGICAVSPDGRLVGIVSGQRLKIMPMKGTGLE